jgi:hypothetical protein
MKPIFLYLASLVVTQSAFAVDKQVTCDGTNCAVKIYSRVGSTLTESATISGGGSAIKGSTSGAAIGAGYVGQMITGATSSGISITSAPTNIGNGTTTGVITLTPGVYILYAGGTIVASDATVYMPVSFAQLSGSSTITDLTLGHLALVGDDVSTLIQGFNKTAYVNVTSTALIGIQVVALVGGTGSNGGVSRLYTIRIA